MNIRDTFINLTRKTYPYGYEELLTSFLPKGYRMDEDGNYFYEVGSGSKNIFASHLDTACKTHTEVVHKFDGKFIRTNGKTILGADDKAGVTILLYMIYHNVPGLYYFFVGEECGCIGSTAASKRTEFFSKYNKIVSFDRRGTNSIITHQSSRRTCSDEFANSLSKEFARYNLNLEKDDTGVYTDSAEFVGSIPECTNISVGYYNEHTHSEHQDIEFLISLAESCVLVDWDKLEIKRDISKTEYKDYSNYYYYGGSTSYSSNRNTNWRSRDYGYGDSYGGGYYGSDGSYKKTRRGKKKKYESEFDNSWWSDEEYYGQKYKKSPDFYYKDGQKVYYNDIENEMIKVGNQYKSSDKTINILEKYDVDSHKTDFYKGVRGMFLNDSITRDEFKIIKEQCLNMLDESDKDFAKYMESTLFPVDNI